MNSQETKPAETAKSIISQKRVIELYLALSELRAVEFYNNTIGGQILTITEKIALIKLYCWEAREQLVAIDRVMRLDTSVEYNVEYKIVETILTEMETAIKAIN